MYYNVNLIIDSIDFGGFKCNLKSYLFLMQFPIRQNKFNFLNFSYIKINALFSITESKIVPYYHQ